ncbi:MAG: diguanylate cyclase [bacterium]|nr:diguanylate cyclase [bacterium]
MKVHLVNSTKGALTAVKESMESSKSDIFDSKGFDNALEEIEKNASRLVLINWGKSDDSAVLDLCKKIKRLRHAKYVYIIVIAAREKHSSIQKAFDAGADDFVFRPFGKEELDLRARIAKKVLRLEDTASKSSKRLIKLAKEDPLTNLLNRRALLDEALKEMGRSSREKKFLSSIMTGITNFKDIVEEHGSETGDGVLIEFAHRLMKLCRPYDKLGRYGIADFLVFMPDTGIGNAKKVSERFLSSLVKKPFVIKDNKISLEVSVGISELNPDDVSLSNHLDDHMMNDLLLDSLVRRAEIAMEGAGRNGTIA